MLQLIIGIITLGLPLAAVVFAQRPRSAFLYVLVTEIAALAVLALLLQVLGLFSYMLMAVCWILVLAVGGWYAMKHHWLRYKPITVDWALCALIAIALACLLQVHFHYTGDISYVTDETVGYHAVSGFSYAYPYFSDEWDTIAIAQQSIAQGIPPFTNPFNQGSFYNFTWPFYAMVSGVFMVLSVAPLAGFAWLQLFFSLITIVVLYMVLREADVGKLPAAVAALMALYVASASNLPGLWYLLAVNVGLLICLIGFGGMSSEDSRLAVLVAPVACIFYPPLALLYLPALFVFLVQRRSISWKLLYPAVMITACAALIGYLAWLFPQGNNLITQIAAKIWYPSLSYPYRPQYSLFLVVPWPAFILGLLGIFTIKRKQPWLLASLIVGGVFWLLYSVSLWRFLIEYERVAFSMGILVVLASGLGMEHFVRFVDKHLHAASFPISRYILVGVLAVFVILVPSYTNREYWKQLVLLSPDSTQAIYPRAPANQYLIQDDLRLFSGISGKRFLSVPWKGLVVGVATGNEPILAKEGTVSVGKIAMISKFIQATCQEKLNLAKRWRLDYIYLYQTACPGFTLIGQSAEGLYLYSISL